MSLTKQIAQFIYDFEYDQIPEQAIRVIKNAFIDTIAVGIAGSNEDSSKIVKEFVKSEDSRGVSTIWNSYQKASPSYAALVNGAMSHALDFDDVNTAVQGHPSTVIVPTVMAAAEEVGASGKSAILAYFVGFEVMAYAGKLVGVYSYHKGWHGTATLGVIGATATAGKLYGLNVEQLEHAIGIAVSNSSGVMQNFGTMTKPYHPGNAARAAIVSATLAKSGFTANRKIIEGSKGFIALYGDRKEPATTEKIGEKFELIETGIGVKKYACCYATHRSADAVLELLKETTINPEDIKAIHVRGPKGAFTPVIYTEPITGLEGKFSVELVIAAAFIDHKISLNTFTDCEVQRENVQRLLCKVTKSEDSSIPIKENGIMEGFIELTITLKKEKLVKKISHPKGSAEWPLTQEELHEKFMDCTNNRLKQSTTSNVWEILDQLENQNELIELYLLLSESKE